MCRAWGVHTVRHRWGRATTITTFRALTVRAGGGYIYRMCLIALAYQVHPRFPLIVAANRDEVRERPTAPAQFWPDAPEFLAGRDQQAGGTWLGITRTGRFAAITNHRDLRRPRTVGPSRGQLVKQALLGTIDPQTTAAYEGFNLLYGPLRALRYHNNIQPADLPLAPGVHGISNAFLNTPWPKVERAKADLHALLEATDPPPVEALFAVLTNDALAADAQLPDTGLPLELERAASSIFIPGAAYGTRCSTVLLVDAEGAVYFEERSWPGATRVVERFRLEG